MKAAILDLRQLQLEEEILDLRAHSKLKDLEIAAIKESLCTAVSESYFLYKEFGNLPVEELQKLEKLQLKACLK